MKLSLLSEMDNYLRKITRAAQEDPGDIEKLGLAMRSHARSRPSTSWKEPGVKKHAKKLKKFEQSWRLDSYPFTISYNSNSMTRQEAITRALSLLKDNNVDTRGWDVYDEDVDDPSLHGLHNHYLGIDIEVPSSFIEHLEQVAPGGWTRSTSDWSVTVDAEWYDD